MPNKSVKKQETIDTIHNQAIKQAMDVDTHNAVSTFNRLFNDNDHPPKAQPTPRPSKPQITALDEGEAVGLSKADFVKLTRYIILLEGYADALEIALQE